jgi:HAD superfamily hydrolase (TIGR01450 family)
VLWQGETLIPGIHETLNALRAQKKQLLFVSNNSTKSRRAYLKKFHELGLTEVKPEDIFSSAFAAAVYLKHRVKFPEDQRVYVIGESGITEELDFVSIKWSGADVSFE